MHQIIDKGGAVLIGASVGQPSSIFAGAHIMNCSLSQAVRQTSRQAHDNDFPQVDVTGIEYQIQIGYSVQDDDTTGMLGVPLNGYSTYKSQNTARTVLFAGTTKKRGADDTQGNRGGYADQRITLVGTGVPDVGDIS